MLFQLLVQEVIKTYFTRENILNIITQQNKFVKNMELHILCDTQLRHKL